MKAVVQDRYGPPEVLRVEEVERPVPKDDEVLVRVHASTVTQTDTHARAAYPFFWRLFLGIRRPKARTLGVELAGEVEAVGAAVREFKVGDEVFGSPSRYFGAHAEYVCVRETGPLAPKPAGLSFEGAAAVCDGAFQALSALRLADVAARAPARHLRRIRLARHGGRAAREALRRPRHRRLRPGQRRARAVARRRRGRRLPPAGLHEERPAVRRDHRCGRQVLVPSRPPRAASPAGSTSRPTAVASWSRRSPCSSRPAGSAAGACGARSADGARRTCCSSRA